jgi:hypothetical protein
VGLIPVFQVLQRSGCLGTYANQVSQDFEDPFSSCRPGTGVVEVGVDDHIKLPAGVGSCHLFQQRQGDQGLDQGALDMGLKIIRPDFAWDF